GIVKLVPESRQTALLSATLTAEVRAIAQRYTKNPATVAVSPETPTVDAIDQAWIEVREADKVSALHELLGRSGVERTLVFRRTKYGADKLVKALDRLGRPARHRLHVCERDAAQGFRRHPPAGEGALPPRTADLSADAGAPEREGLVADGVGAPDGAHLTVGTNQAAKGAELMGRKKRIGF